MLLKQCCFYVPLKTATIIIGSVNLCASVLLLASCFLFVNNSLPLTLPPITGLIFTNMLLIYSAKKETPILMLPCLIIQIALSIFVWYVKYSRYVVDYLTASYHIIVLALLTYLWFIVYCYYFELKFKKKPKTYIEFDTILLPQTTNIDEDKECDTSLLVRM